MPGAHKENSSRTESPVELLHNISQDSGISRSPAQFSNNSSVSLSASMERPSGRSLESHPKQKWRLGELFKRSAPDLKFKSGGGILPSWKDKIEDSKFKIEVQRSYNNLVGRHGSSEEEEEEYEEDDGIILEDYDGVQLRGSLGSLASSSTANHINVTSPRGKDISHNEPLHGPGTTQQQVVPPLPPPRDLKRRLQYLNSSPRRPLSYSFENISSVKDPDDLGLPPVWNNRPQRLIYSPPTHAYVSPSSSHYVQCRPSNHHDDSLTAQPPPLPPRREESQIHEESLPSTPQGNEFWKSPPFPFVPSNPPPRRGPESPSSNLSSIKSQIRSHSHGSRSIKETPVVPKGSIKSGKLSPSSSISSKDSGCSEIGSKPSSGIKLVEVGPPAPLPPVSYSSSPPRSGDKDPGFSTKQRRSLFRDALFELEAVFDDIQKDEALLDRAERRDLPTAHQELIYRSRREHSSDPSTTTASEETTAFSDMDNFMNWNTSSSFENLSRPRTPGYRRSGVIDKKTDDMAYRKARDNNKLPNTDIGKSEQSYLLLSSAFSPRGSMTQLPYEIKLDPDEPDTHFDDVLFRNIRDANASVQSDPQPKFGIPVGPISCASDSDYLHAVPEGKYRSTFHAMRNPDLVLDDLALRKLRKDGNLSDPNNLGIVKEPNAGSYHSCWKHKMLEKQKSLPEESDVFYPDKNNPIMLALSKDIAEIIKKQSGIASAGDDDEIVTYGQLSTGLEGSRPAVMEAAQAKSELQHEWSGQTVYSLLSGSGGDTRDIQEQLQDVVDTIDRDLELCQKNRDEPSKIAEVEEEEENSIVEPVPLFNNSETESSSLSKMSSIHEDKDSREGLKTRGSYLEEDVSSEVVLPPQSLRRLKDSSSSSKSPIPILEDSFAPKRIEYSLSMHHRRPARSKEDRRRGSSVSRLLPPPSSSSSSSSDEESSSLQHESYSRYRRRRRKKRKNKRVTATASPEHIYHTIDSEGTRSKSSSYELTESLNQSTSSLKLPHSRGVAAAPLLLGGGPPLSPSMKRKSLLNTSYSSEEILIQAVNSLHGLGDELKASVSSNSSSPQTPMSTLGGSHSAGSKTLSSPDIVKSLSKTLTPPISPHHHRPFLPAPAVERSDLISDPLLEHWPGRPKSSSSNNNFHNNNTNSSNSSSNNNNVKKLSDKTTTSPITSPSATSASKPPIFPLLNGGANGSHPSSSSSIKGLGAISLRKPSESFLSRRTSSPDNSTPQFVKEFRRRSGGFTPNEVLPPASRPQSAVFLRSPEDNEPGGHVKFNSEVLENNAGEPPVPAPRESLLRKKSLKESEPAQVAMRNRSSSLTLHDKRSPDPNHHSSSSSCNSSNSSSSLLPKPILKKSSEDLLKDPCNSFSGILKRKSSEYDHIRIQSPSPDAGDLRPILRGCSLGGEGEEEDSPQSILKRSLDEDDPSSSSIENISPQGILKRRSSSVGVIGDRSLDDLSEEPSLRPSILKKQGSMEELIDVKSILKKTDDELEEEVRGGGGSSCTTPKSILKSRKSEESLSSPLDSCEVYRRTHEEEGIRRPILKRKESREELLLAVSHRLSQRSFRSPDVEHRSILIRPRPSSLGSPREESVEYSSRSEPLVGAISNRLRRADSEQNYSSPSRTYVSLSEARRAAASTAVSTTSTAASSASSSNPKRSSSLRSVNDYEQENNKIEKGQEGLIDPGGNKGPFLPPISNKRRQRDNIPKRFITQPITIDEVQMAAQMRNQILMNNNSSGGALSFGGAVVFGTGSNRESSSGDGKRRRSSDNSGANSSSGSCNLRKEEPYGILKRRVSRRDYEFEGETTSHSLSGGSSTNSTPRKSILKYDGDHVGIIGGGDASINPLNSNPSPSSQSEDKRLKGVLKKDSSYEETLRRPILKNTSTEENISFQEQQHQQSSLLLSSSCSSEDIARTFNDVIIDPIPNERRHEEEEDAEAALPREEDVEEAQPEEEEQQMRVSKLSEPPPSVVNISADGDLASKLQQLAVKAEAIKQQQQQQKETSRMPLTTPLNKCIKKSASFREPRSTSQHASSSRPTIRNRSSSRSLTTEVSADEYYQIFKQQKKRTEGDGDEDFSASSSSLSNSPSSKEHRMREILEKENSVPKRPKPEIKINGGGIADRLAALKKNGEEGWKKKVQKMDVIETTASVPNGGGGGREKTNENSRPSSLTDRLSQLQSSQNTWQCKVASDKKEASKFTVAGKMSRFGVISHNSSGGESGDEERTRCTPRLRSFGSPKLVRPRSCIIEDDSPSSSSSGLGRRKLSTPVSRSKSSVEHRRRVVILPSGSNDEEDGGLRDFYGKIEEDPKVALPSLPLNTDLDAVMGGSEDFKPLSAVKRAKGPLNKRRPTSGNPIKKLAAREDILHVYTESVKTTTTTREEAVASKSSKQSHLAAEALAGLASKEDFSSVQLKRGNTSVPNQEFLPYKEDLMLLQVKGRRHCQTRLVEPRASSINSGDCYVLVTLSEVFHWIGRFSNVIERARSAEVALHIQQVHDLGFKGSSRVITVEDPSHNRKFWSYLSGGSEPMEAGPSDEDELYEGRVNEFNLIWEVSPLDGTLNPVQDFWGTVPRYSLLDPEKVLVLDFGSELYLWSGKTAGFELRKAGLQSIKELWDSGYDFEEGSVNPVLGSDLPCKAPARPSWCILGRVNSHMETVLFREKFQDWPQDESSRVIQKNKGEERKIKVVRSQISPEPEERSIFDIQSYDAEEMAQFPLEDPDMELENSHLGRGSGYYDETERRNYEIETLDISVWYMQEFNENRLCLEEWKAQFHVEDAYIVRWKYKVSLTGRDLKGNPSKHSAVGRERIAFFFWQGSESGVNEKGASALKTVELDRERGPQIRVDQGREEAAFLHLWAGQMMVHFGKRNKRRRSSEHHRLYVLRGVTPQEVHLVEVECQSSSLRSLGTFILFSPEDSQIHIWHGRDSPPIGRELARGFVNRFKADPPLHELDYAPGREISISEEMHDGHSTSGPVFEALGANIGPLNLLYPPSMSPRLYRMTSVSGRFLVNEFLCLHRKVDTRYSMPFHQVDLYNAEQPALFLLDLGPKLWLWQGWWPERDSYKDGSVRWHAERRAAMQTASDHWALRHGGGEPRAQLVWAGHEPEEFKHLFPSWKTINDVQDLNQPFVGSSDLMSVLSSLSRMEYSWNDLCKSPLPDGVDPSKLEKYLNEQEFKEYLGLSREDFSSSPKWKQIEIRKEKGLF